MRKNIKKLAAVGLTAVPGAGPPAGWGGGLRRYPEDHPGLMPADNPRYVITVVLKDPQGSFGGLTAGPLTAEIGEFLMQKYEVPASSPRTDAIAVNW